MTGKVLVTGGAGYIGSHTTLTLLEAGFDVVVLDNFCNSSRESLNRIKNICGKSPIIVEGDIRDKTCLDQIFQNHKISSVLHFAGLKAVGESVSKPLDYYDNNVTGSIILSQAMARAGVFNLVFSSSATVYGEPKVMPISESHPTGEPTNPYGRSKLMVEQLINDLVISDERWRVAILRYFNPVGAHPSGLIGEDPHGIPNNLVPFISRVAIGKLDRLSIFGDDYETPDGTGIRDYIHVVDLANGHVEALNAIRNMQGLHVWNLGTGIGYSVLQIVAAFQKASDKVISYKIVARRPGDIAECWSNPEKAFKELGWKANRGLDEMMLDTWRWQSHNPNGYCLG
jgi:UDP-glucose 4-epimerase